jgi:hypothetical protein
MAIDPRDDFYHGGVSPLEAATGKIMRVALLFGSATIAIALIATAALDARLDSQFARNDLGIDRMATGSIGYNGTYVMRRSVLQSSRDSVCILRDNGTQSGEC